MKTLIAYATRYGATEKASRLLSEELEGDVHLCNLSQDPAPDISAYDRIIIGGSIYVGQIQDDVKTFCTENLASLQQKPLGLFICCGDEDRAQEQLEQNFDAALMAHATAVDCFGYEYDFAKMNFLFRLIIRAKAGVRQSESRLRAERIGAFAQAFNTATE